MLIRSQNNENEMSEFLVKSLRMLILQGFHAFLCSELR